LARTRTSIDITEFAHIVAISMTALRELGSLLNYDERIAEAAAMLLF
jgi:hypothetical protein